MQSANWVSAENGLCVVQTTEINEFGTGSRVTVASRIGKKLDFERIK